MNRHYAIWDKKTPIITPIMEVLQPEEWIARYPAAGLESVTVVCSAGEINGGFFGTLGQMMQRYEGIIDFSKFDTADAKLEAIELYEEEQNILARNKIEEEALNKSFNEEMTAASLASIAASMEYQNMLTLPDEEV